MTDDPREIWRRETEPGADELDALRTALLGRPSDAGVSRTLLAHLPPPDRVEIAEIRDRLDARRRGRRRLPWVLVGTAGAGALALALLALILRPVVVAPPPEVPVPLAVHLGSEAPAESRPAPGVALRFDGSGEIAGTSRAPEIAWTGGSLAVEVDPGEGIALTVVTREAVVRVIGTVFTVERDALGTRVDVARGKVEVACVDGPTHALGAKKSATCLPTTAPGLLARANQLKKDGAPPRQILEAVAAGLPLASGPFLPELLALEAETLLASGRERPARASADRYLELGGPRRVEVLRIGATAACRTDGCAGALPYLRELGDEAPPELARCGR